MALARTSAAEYALKMTRAFARPLWALVSILGLACGGEDGPAPSEPDGPPPGPPEELNCPSTPLAHVWPTPDSDVEALLTAAGFEVRAVPSDESPEALKGVVVLPTDASATPGYRQYMDEYSGDLYKFVERANVLLQLGQRAEDEVAPPFLPTTQGARRSDAAVERVGLPTADHPLLQGVPTSDDALQWQGAGVARGLFAEHGGFEVVLESVEPAGAVLLEGTYGRGRFVLTELTPDQPRPEEAGAGAEAEADRSAFAEAFFHNVHQLVVDVCERNARAVQLAPREKAERFTEGSTMVAVLPDTQIYSLRFPGMFTVQTAWLADQARALNITYALHLGDLVNDNTPLEWERAASAMSLLDGAVPVALVPGNHDYGPLGDASTRDTLLNDYFSFDQTAALPGFGGAYVDGMLDNTYHLLTIRDRDYVLLALEWGPRDEVVQWANDIMDLYPERDGILVTHAYMNNNDRRYDHTDTDYPQAYNPHQYATPGGVNDGEELWQKLVRHHRFVMTLNGHVLGDGTGYLASTTDRGNTCHQMLSNYQMRELGGEAFLRLLEFPPDSDSVVVHSYSPLYDRFLDEPDQSFAFTLD